MAHSHGGAKLGTKVAYLVSTALVSTHQKLVYVKHKLAMMIFHSISDMISGEVHRSLDATLTSLYEGLPETSPAKPLLDFMANETGQLQAMSGISTVAGAILGSVSAIVNNELMPIVREALSTNPHMIPDPATIAQLTALGLADTVNGLNGIAENGIDTGWGMAMIKAAQAHPDAGTATELLRRNLIDEGTFMQWAQLNGYAPDVAAHLAELKYQPISPADAALAVLRGNLPMDQGLEIAHFWGVEDADFQTLLNNTGEPLGLMQLLEAYRRGFIDQGTLERGIQQSRVRDEWIGVAEQLRYTPMTVSDAVNAVVQGHLDMGTGASIADQNGLQPGAFETLYETAGEPLSRTEMEELYNRGMVTEAQVTQALSESRLKDKYTSLAFALHTRLLSEGSISDAVLYGAMSHGDALNRAMQLGYDSESASIAVSSAVNRKLATLRQEVIAAVVSLYEANAMSLEDAQSLIGQMGYEQNEAQFVIQVAEFRRNQKLLTSAMNAIRSKYIGHHIDQNTASGYLDALGTPSQQRDQVIQVWTIEREANVAMLTEAQIVKAVTNQLITEQEGLQRLTDRGYSDDDAALLLAGA